MVIPNTNEIQQFFKNVVKLVIFRLLKPAASYYQVSNVHLPLPGFPVKINIDFQ